MNGRGLIFGIALVASSSLAMADERVVEKYGDFQCLNGFGLVQPRSNLVKVSMPQITEEQDLGNPLRTEVRINLPIQNKAPTDLYFASDFLFLNSAGRPIAALNVSPSDFRVGRGQSITASGVTSVSGSVGLQAKQLCMRWFIMQVPKSVSSGGDRVEDTAQ